MSCKHPSRGLFTAALLIAAPPELFGQAVSGKFYYFEGVGVAGVGGATSVLAQGPSINDNGKIAFVGVMPSTQRALFVSDPGAASPRLIAQYNAFSLGGGLGIDDSDRVSGREVFPPAATQPQF